MRTIARLGTSAVAVTVLTVGLASPQAAAELPEPGAPSAGDRLFPGLGNGGYDVNHYDVAFDYDAAKKKVAARVGVTAKATQALSRLNLDFSGADVESVTVDGREAKYSAGKGELVVTPGEPLTGSFRVEVAYTADPAGDYTCTGGNAAGDTAWLPFEGGFGLGGQPNCMNSAIPSNDIPSDKATFTTTVTTPKDLLSVAGGTLLSTRTEGDEVTRRFSARDPLAPELFQVAVGDLALYEHSAPDGTPLRDVVPADQLEKLKPHLDKEGDHIAWMVDKTGVEYPFDTYGSLGLPSEFGFALETQTLSVFSADDLAAADHEPLMVHELAHQWFGDHVAPATWSDLWLNEGHATWYEAEHSGDLDARMKKAYRAGDEWREKYGPVAKPKSAETMFSDNVYDGGALVLYALRQQVGDETFREIEHQWLVRNADGVASTDDFIALASEVSGEDLDGFLRDWAYGTKTPPMPGHPDW